MMPSSSLLHPHRGLSAPVGCPATPLHARPRWHRRTKLCPRPEMMASSTRAAVTHAPAQRGLRPGQVHGVARAAAAGASLAAALLLQLAPVSTLTGPVLAADGAVMRQAMQGAASPAAVTAPGVGAAAGSSGAANDAASMQTIYFGNGCFWGRQKDFVEVESGQLGRSPEQLTALVGYAAGTRVGPDGKVCYYYADPRTQYEALGHAEVVRLGITAGDQAAAEREMRAFAARYFEQFTPLIDGTMDRLDPQDQGPAYRNVIGIPGGVNSPLFPIIQEANKYGMELREGRGNDMQRGRPTEGDLLNVVWVVDSDKLPFYRAERYHQFHHGLGKLFSMDYVRDLRNQMMGLGKIDPTGCPELPF